MSDCMESGSPDVQLNEFPFCELTLRKARRNTLGLWFIFSVCLFALCGRNASAQSQYQSSTDFAKFAIKLRENGLLSLNPKPGSTVDSVMAGRSLALDGGLERRPWKIGIVTTVFWIGE